MNIFQYKKLEEIRRNFEKTGNITDVDIDVCEQALLKSGEEPFVTAKSLKIVLSNWNVFWKKVAPVLVGKPGESNEEFNKEWEICSRGHNVDFYWILGGKQDCFDKYGYERKYLIDFERLEKIPLNLDDSDINITDKDIPYGSSVFDYVIDITDKNIKKKCPLFLKVMKTLKLNSLDNDTLLRLYDIANGTNLECNYNQDFIDGKVNVNIYDSSRYNQSDLYYDKLADEKFLQKIEEDSKKKYIYSKIEENQFNEYASKKRNFTSLNYGAQKEAYNLAVYRKDIKHSLGNNIKFRSTVKEEKDFINKIMKQNIR